MTDAGLRRTTTVLANAQTAYRRMSGTSEIVVVRHGSADVACSDEVIEGQTNAPLTREGRRQAELVGERLAGAGLSRLFVTTMQRTAQTAAPLVAAIGIEPAVIADLREYDLGDYDGAEFERRRATGDALLIRAFQEQRFDLLPGSESSAAFAARVARGLAAVVAATGADRTSAVFTHAVVVAEICRQVTGSEPFAFLGVENGSISTVIVDADKRLRLRSFNDTAHLETRSVGVLDAAEQVSARIT